MVGKLKRPWLVDEISDEGLDSSRASKFALDLDGISNPGCVFEEAKL